MSNKTNVVENSFADAFPQFLHEWSNKNEVQPHEIGIGGNTEIWFECWSCKSEYKRMMIRQVASYRNRLKFEKPLEQKQGCPYCTGRKVNHTNSLAMCEPELAKEWDHEKNELTPDTIKHNSSKKVWWKCTGNNHSFFVSPVARKRSIKGSKGKANGCNICSGKVVHKDNCLATLSPRVAKEWYYEKNYPLTPNDIVNGSTKKMWWKCEKGHEWETPVFYRTGKDKTNCPYCANRMVWQGWNDFWTTHPELAKYLVNSEEGYSYPAGSYKKVNWKCVKCETLVPERSFFKTIEAGHINCPTCNPNASRSERLVAWLLKESGYEFSIEKSFSWLKNKQYDFYIPSIETIIEVHGIQHYEDSSDDYFSNRVIEEEQANDKLKRESAIKNGIKHYIEIDCSSTKFDDWRKNLETSTSLQQLIDFSKVNWLKLEMNSYAEFVLDIIHKYLCGEDTQKIADDLGIIRGTVNNYLNRANKLKLLKFPVK